MLKVFVFLIVCMLAGCYTPSPIPFDLESESAAQLRVSRIANVWIDSNSECIRRKGVPLNLNGGLSQLEKSNLIGMPKTNDDFPSFAHEYRIPSGKPVTISFDYRSETHLMKTGCGPVGATFTPEPGALYDAQLRFENGYCFALIRQLMRQAEAPNQAVASVIKHKPAYKCPD